MIVTWAALRILLPLLVLAFGLGVTRLLLGPTLADRVIAMDLLATISIGILAVLAIATGEEVLIDVATLLALLGFLTSVGFAYYIYKSVHT
jgi:multicomponent Na+:H+ antiporter subunit F